MGYHNKGLKDNVVCGALNFTGMYLALNCPQLLYTSGREIRSDKPEVVTLRVRLYNDYKLIITEY